MAWTTTKKNQFNAGGTVIQNWDLTADSATLELDTGLNHLDAVTMSPASIGTALTKYAVNVLTTSTAAAGYVSITGAASGDHIFLTVYGN